MLLTITKLLLVNFFLLSGTLPTTQPAVIEGRVLWETNKSPAVNVYVYITEGVEEALTDKEGNFSIRTWKKLPTELVVKYKDQKTHKTSVRDPGQKVVIYLK